MFELALFDFVWCCVVQVPRESRAVTTWLLPELSPGEGAPHHSTTCAESAHGLWRRGGAQRAGESAHYVAQTLLCGIASRRDCAHTVSVMHMCGRASTRLCACASVECLSSSVALTITSPAWGPSHIMLLRCLRQGNPSKAPSPRIQ